MSNLKHPERGLFWRLIVFGLLCPMAIVGAVSMSTQGQVGTVDWHDVAAQAADKDDVDSGLLRGIAYANLGDLAEAMNEFAIAGQDEYSNDIAGFVLDKLFALRQSPQDLLLLNCAAFGTYAFGDLEASAGYFERIIDLDERNVWARNFAAIVYGYLGEFHLAQDHLKSALAVDGKNQYTHLLLSAVYKEQHQYLSAIYHYLMAPDAVRELRNYGIF